MSCIFFNFSKPVCPIYVCKSVRPMISNKPLYPVNVYTSVRPVDVCKPVFLVDILKPFFVNYWRYVILFLILLFSVVSVNTCLITILYMIIFISVQMTYLVFTKFFKWIYVILINYFFYIAGSLFKYFFKDFYYLQAFFNLLLVIFVINFAFINIYRINYLSFDADNLKTIDDMFLLTIMADDIQIMGKKYSYLSLSHLKILSYWIIFFRTALF